MVNAFSIPAFFIVLREVLEACLVVGIVLAYLAKTGATQLRKYVWMGAAVGVAISGIIGVTFAALYYSRGQQLFDGKSEIIFEGFAFLLAAALLTWMILWMMVMGKNLRQHLETKVDKAIEAESSGKAAALVGGMVGVQVLREGVETFIFLFGASASNQLEGGGVDKNAWKSIILPGILGLFVGLAVSYVVFRGLVTLDIQSFFLISSLVLMAFAAALVSRGLHELQELDWFGAYETLNGKEIDSIDRPWQNATMWSTKGCCNDEENEFFAMLRALFGYQDLPSFIEFASYFAYWAVVLGVLAWMNWSTIRAARNKTAKYARGCAAFALISSFVGFIYASLNATWTGLVVTIFGLLLSIATTLVVFDVLTDFFKAIGALRRPIALACGVGLALFTVFVSVLHLVQMSCLEKSCELPKFYYWGLIFQSEWNEAGNTGTSWHSVGVLAVSFVFSFFFLGMFAIIMFLYSGHIASDGAYIYEDRVKVGDGAAGVNGPSLSDSEEQAESSVAVV
jgi:high-affinity iron transporter